MGTINKADAYMKNFREQQMAVTCKCDKEVVLQVIGGQYQDSYSGVCRCGRKWVLEDLSEDLTEE